MSRNRTPQSQRDWRSFKAFCKHILVAVISIFSVLVVSCLLVDIAIFLKGRAVDQQIWLIVHEHSLLGIGFWIIAFPLASCRLLYFIKQKLSRSSSLPYWTGGLTALICYFVVGISVSLSSRQDIPLCVTVAQIIKNLIAQ